MSLMVDPEYNWFFGIIAGSNWPQGDEDKLRALAADWDGVAADLGRAGEGFGPLSKEVTGSVGGTVGRNFVRFGHKLGSYQGDFAQSAAGQAQLLRQQALNVENAKYSILIQIAFTAWEIISALADPFTAPLVPEIILEGQLAVRALMKRFFGRTAGFIRAAISEGVEEVVQDAIAQLIQIAQHNRDGVDWSSLGMSAGLGVGAGAFGHGVHKGLAKYDPKFANSWQGAATTGAVTDLGVGLATLPMGGDPSGLGWSVLNGGLTSAATHAAHRVHQKDTPDPKFPNIDGDNVPTDFDAAPPYDAPPPYDTVVADHGGQPTATTSTGSTNHAAPGRAGTPATTTSPQAHTTSTSAGTTTPTQTNNTTLAGTETPTNTAAQSRPNHTITPDTATQPTPTETPTDSSTTTSAPPHNTTAASNTPASTPTTTTERSTETPSTTPSNTTSTTTTAIPSHTLTDTTATSTANNAPASTTTSTPSNTPTNTTTSTPSNTPTNTTTPTQPSHGTGTAKALATADPPSHVTPTRTSTTPGERPSTRGITTPTAAAFPHLATASPVSPTTGTTQTNTKTPTTEPKTTSALSSAPTKLARHLDFETDLTDRTNRELERIGRPDVQLSKQDVQNLREQRAGRPLARDVVGLSNQLAQIALTGDIVRLLGGTDDEPDIRTRISFAQKQKGELSTEQLRQIAGIATSAADLLQRDRVTQQLGIQVTGYGNGEFFLLDKTKTHSTALETSTQRANLVATELTKKLTQEFRSRPGFLSVLQDVRFAPHGAGRGGPEETDTSRRRVDIEVRRERRQPRRVPFATPADLSHLEVPGRDRITGMAALDPTLPIRTFLDGLATRLPPDHTTRPAPRPRLRLDDVLRRDQRWLAYISPDDHAKAQTPNPKDPAKDHGWNPDDPGSYYKNNFQAAMAPAVDNHLQGDGIDVSQLDWNTYEDLHAQVTDDVRGNFAQSGQGSLGNFMMRTPEPAHDIRDERIGGRRLMAPAGYRPAAGEGRPLTTWAPHAASGYTAITTRYRANDAPRLVNEIFDRFRRDIARADDDHARLIAIARTVRALHVLHLHLDGNGRLNVFILLPRLLMEYGFHPMYLDHGDPDRRAVLNSIGALFNGGYTLEQIATAIRFLQPRFGDAYYGADTPQGRQPATDTGDAVFGTPADQEPVRHQETRKRPAEQDQDDDSDTEQAKRPRVLEVLPGSAEDAVFSALHDVRRDAAGRQNTLPPRPWAFTEPETGPESSRPRVLTRDTFPEHSLEPIRYLREHHADLVGLNAVHYHAAHPDYLVNCVNVAVSVADTLNGHRHVPLPAGGTRRGSLIEQHFGRPVRPLANPDGIVAELVAAGPGAHGIVFDIGPNGDGHVFTALHDPRTNDIVLLDAQSGRFAAVRADHTYGFLLTSGPAGDTATTSPFSHHDFGANTPDRIGPRTISAPYTAHLPAPLTVNALPSLEDLAQTRELAVRAAAVALDHLHYTGRRVVITVTGYGPPAMVRTSSVRSTIDSAVRDAFAERQHLAPRELDADDDVRVVHETRDGGSPRIEISIGTEPHPSAPPRPTFPRTGPFSSDPTSGTRTLLDNLAVRNRPDHTPRQQLQPIRLDRVLWRSQRWLAYISPDDHQTAVTTRPGNPGGMYRDNFQGPMNAAVENILQNGNIGDRLTWDSYKLLHEHVVRRAEGGFGRTGNSHRAGYSLRGPAPAADILTDRLGGRPLMSDDPADNPLTLWQWSDRHNSAIAVTRYGASETRVLVDEVFDRMYAELTAADTDHGRMIAIARAVRTLHVLHPYVDGNGRLNVFILLPHLLMRHGFRPMYIGETDDQREILLAMGALFNGGYTLDQIATAIRMFQPARADEDLSADDYSDDGDPDDFYHSDDGPGDAYSDGSGGIEIGDLQHSDE